MYEKKNTTKKGLAFAPYLIFPFHSLSKAGFGRF
jgi:hypothetical protein